MSRLAPIAPALLALGLAIATAACPSTYVRSPDALDPDPMPEEVRADYAVFAVRCSKCHSLARPLNSGIVDDDYWSLYVARMRRQPGSGISEDDSKVILRFLHWYSLDQKRQKAARELGAGDAGP
jgi:hypothetical protein